MKVCLVIIYNHNFERNIPVLDRIYAGRFSHIYHLVPFYTGDRPNVIGVYENSFQFSGYIAQFYQHVKGKGFSHFVFVADDMVINPELNEGNILECLKLADDESMITSMRLIDDTVFTTWERSMSSYHFLSSKNNACDFWRFLPSQDEAKSKLESLGFDVSHGVSVKLFKHVTYFLRSRIKAYYEFQPLLLSRFAKKHPGFFTSEEKMYPLMWGYSDFLVVPASAMEKFSLYCGVFAAVRVFVEVAIPTALCFASSAVKLVPAAGYKCENGVQDYKVRQKLEQDSGLSYKRLMANFPKDYLFIHPIKLSKWKDLP